MNTFTDDTANFLSTKLDLLRESPGGLKLNPQLTSFLTTLCFHHIRIWQNYAKLLFTKIMLNRSYLYVICCLNSAFFLGNGMTHTFDRFPIFKVWSMQCLSFETSFSIRYVQSADLAFLLLLYLFAPFISSMDIWTGWTSQFIPRFEI